ncbi:Por secretion system C-terminal sorting domain-containing protein [Chitinophaga sp. CF118]|uniref:type IX secretion system anionic LPS delivery protein PorZ n=1 Tax=Chitinophaga sp. CF118 TaxID=1884367 RepID=UPI0008F0751F|nr:two-component regulator propeller domain-containing protein [Chitinophaga sp. CF118]SFD29625.1 Por secretion system C-terminal sorting domain-containing protein [Chitinophaga sp. CF118]
MYRFLTLLFIFLYTGMPSHAQTPLGQWQEYLPWLPAVAVTLNTDKVFCATSAGLFSVTTGEQQDITRYSKVNGLHDIGISTIGSNNNSVLIAYRNSNLDLLQGNNIYNIPDIQRKQISADKSIFRILFSNNNAYLCTGLGIVVVNTSKPEIADTWITGNSGAYTPVYALAINNNYFYAATAEGIKKAPVAGSNLADFRNWTPVLQGLQPDTVWQVIQLGNTLICQQGKQLYKLENDTWQPWYTDGNPITNLSVNDQLLLVCEMGSPRIVTLQMDGTTSATLQDKYIEAPLATVANGQETWIADSLQGLIRYSNGLFTPIAPNGPASIITGDMIFVRHTLWAAAGGVNDTWNATGNNNGYYTFNKGEWQQFHPSVKDLLTLTSAPDGNGVYAGSFGSGLLYLGADGSYINYTNVTNVSGLATDALGNLWVADYGASRNLLVKKPDNSWISFRSPYAQTYNAISQLVADDYGQVWMASPQGNGLFVLNYANTLENTADDQWRQFRMGAQQGNLPSNDVYCLAKDKNGSIWVGTGRGIAIMNCSQEAATGACNAYLPIIKQDDFAGYLFQDEQVNTIAVDGANRKWVGTLNGAWLVSADGESILEQFSTTNSPLPGNHIYKITIDPLTGEVYFATEKGLMSWHGTATEGTTMQKDSVLVFPNPVPPAYGGTIAIRGLAQNALVKITDISGRLVFQTRALGGQATWNGVDYTGHRPQSGVYLVFATSETEGEHIVAKIVFIN